MRSQNITKEAKDTFHKKSLSQRECDRILNEEIKDFEPPISFSLPTHDNEIKINFECERRRNKDLKCILTSELDTEHQSREILEKLYQENEATSRRKSELLDSIAETKVLFQQVEHQKQKTNNCHNVAKNNVADLKDRNDSLQQELCRLQSTLNTKTEKLRQAQENQKKELALLCKEREQLQAKIKNTENDISLAKTTLKGLKARDAALDKSLVDTQQALDEIKLTHESDITNILLLKEKIESTCQQFQMDKEEELNLKDELQELESLIHEQQESFDCIQNESEVAAIKLKELLHDVDTLRPKDENLRKILSKLEIDSQEKDRMKIVCQQVIQNLQNALCQTQRCCQEKKNMVKQLKLEINTKREAISRFRGLDN